MKSFKESLREKIEREKYVSYGDLVNFALENETKIETMSRRLRELCNEFPIEALEKKGKKSNYIYGYKWKAGAWKEEFVGGKLVSINGVKVSAFPAPFPVKKEQQDKLI